MYIYVDGYGKCLGDGIVRNTAGSGEAGSGRRIPNIILRYYPSFDGLGSRLVTNFWAKWRTPGSSFCTE